MTAAPLPIVAAGILPRFDISLLRHIPMVAILRVADAGNAASDARIVLEARATVTGPAAGTGMGAGSTFEGRRRRIPYCAASATRPHVSSITVVAGYFSTPPKPQRNHHPAPPVSGQTNAYGFRPPVAVSAQLTRQDVNGGWGERHGQTTKLRGHDGCDSSREGPRPRTVCAVDGRGYGTAVADEGPAVDGAASVRSTAGGTGRRSLTRAPRSTAQRLVRSTAGGYGTAVADEGPAVDGAASVRSTAGGYGTAVADEGPAVDGAASVRSTAGGYGTAVADEGPAVDGAASVRSTAGGYGTAVADEGPAVDGAASVRSTAGGYGTAVADEGPRGRRRSVCAVDGRGYGTAVADEGPAVDGAASVRSTAGESGRRKGPARMGSWGRRPSVCAVARSVSARSTAGGQRMMRRLCLAPRSTVQWLCGRPRGGGGLANDATLLSGPAVDGSVAVRSTAGGGGGLANDATLLSGPAVDGSVAVRSTAGRGGG